MLLYHIYVKNGCIQNFSSMSLSAWPALVSGGARIKLKIDIHKPSYLAGSCRGHLLKWCGTVVSLLWLMSK